MTLLNTVTPEEATGKVGELYRTFQDTIGFIPNAFSAMSVSPEILEQHWAYIGYYLNHPTLSPRLTAMIRLLVSQQAQCDYCINLNTALLIKEAGLTPEQITAMKADPAAAPVDEKEKALLLFVLKGTADPHGITEADIQPLRELGYSDSDIHDALNHGARQVSLDIMLNAFKVENDF